MARSSREQDRHPPEIERFVEWGDHQYMGTAWYHGGRMPPLGALLALAWSAAAVLLLLGAAMGIEAFADGYQRADLLSLGTALAAGVAGLGLIAGLWRRSRRLRRRRK